MTAPKHVLQAVDEESARRSLDECLADVERVIDKYEVQIDETDDGDFVIAGKPAKLIAEGSFSRVFLDATDGRVFVATNAATDDKSIAARAHRRFPENPHIPAVEPVGHTDWEKVYVMPRYNRLPQSSAAYDDYARVLACTTQSRGPFQGAYSLDVQPSAIRCVADAGVSPSLVEAFAALTRETRRTGERYTYDVRRANVAVDDAERLVLLDIVFKDE